MTTQGTATMMDETRPTALSMAAIDAYRKSGLHFPVSVMDPAEAALCRANLEAFEREQLGGPLPTRYRYKLHLLLPWLYDLVRNGRVLDAVESVLGHDILVWNSTFFIKEARDPSYVGWHQDVAYWGLTPPEAVTAWVAFTDSTVENGAMRMLPGTFDPLPHLDTYAAGNMLSRGQEITGPLAKEEAVDVTLRAGQAALFDARLAHGSAPNASDDRRIGFAIRYIPTHVRQAPATGVANRSRSDVAVLARGRDAYGNFQLAPRPKGATDPEAVALHAQSV